MTNASAIKQLETCIGKLSYLNYHIPGNQLQTAIREIAYVRDRLESKQLTVKKP